ncbi:hypothetical protein CXF68_16955 [Tenacibaculum sp. Bg11-29]|uniref:DUF6452 family protein n=1 Tax=Tenacibaculum sp. Bg11-29 TaxID=2058306 RepID=UPI000C328383|nr:DUF6452 family protein [Tenacibaculum sp. Bg11-29]PKH52278.1 hypothetical protein CXF68_16955 [Tenacibaculum sp. Bg11-29]
MKKNILLLFICFVGLSSCEKDDFCVQNPVTPRLILSFYDKDDTSLKKKAQRFSMIAQGKTDSLFKSITTDSIAIPLNSLANETIYTLKMNDVDNIAVNNKIATLTIKHNSEDDYVSRSCGYRIVFKDINLTHTSWIDNLSTSTITNINDQTKAHVQVYY